MRRSHYLNELLSAEQRQALTSLIRNDDFNAEQKMIANNLSLVVDVARHYVNRGVTIFDLVREGNLGLIYALEKFEVEGRLCFSTYATQCMRQYIERAITNQNNRAPASASPDIPSQASVV